MRDEDLNFKIEESVLPSQGYCTPQGPVWSNAGMLISKETTKKPEVKPALVPLRSSRI
jgi:hypothetical protein